MRRNSQAGCFHTALTKPKTIPLTGEPRHGIEFRSHFDPLVGVEFQQFLRRNTDLRDASNVMAIQHKMIVPIIFPGMVKQNDFSSIRIEGCQVRPVVAIAIRTC